MSFDPMRCSSLRALLPRERSGEEGRADREPSRDDGLIDAARNALTPEEAVALSRSFRARVSGPCLPDSTPFIRADRDAG